MFKKLSLAIAIATIGISSAAMAANEAGKIDDDQLTVKAEQLLKAEDGAKEATVRVEVAPVETTHKRKVLNLDEFDLNNDGILQRDEIGEKLFRLFDADGNQVIDNIEMVTPRIMVFSDMAKTTTKTVRYHDPDRPAKQVVSQEEFMQASQLARFDKDRNGLSAQDFLGKTFNEVDVRGDGVIDLYEWKRAYADYVRPAHMESYNYND